MLIITIYICVCVCVGCPSFTIHSDALAATFEDFLRNTLDTFYDTLPPDGPVHLRSREAEETIVMKHALRNTTALLRGLAAGNLSDTASLLSGAYAEISSISSWATWI